MVRKDKPVGQIAAVGSAITVLCEFGVGEKDAGRDI
jgi:hypothetical protein